MLSSKNVLSDRIWVKKFLSLSSKSQTTGKVMGPLNNVVNNEGHQKAWEPLL